MTKPAFVWVFNGEGAKFPAGVFSTVDEARRFIDQYSLSGVLTRYPLDISAYDSAINEGVFSPSAEKLTSRFIARFTSATMVHYHFENGKEA